MPISRWFAQGLDWAGERKMGLLRFAVSITLLARGWLTWNWDSPIRSLVWQEDWWSTPLQSLFGVPWNVFAEQSEPGLTLVLESIGVLLMFSAVIPWVMIWEKLRWTVWLLYPAGIVLILDALGRWVAKDYELGMAIEHSLQIIGPFALILATRKAGALWPVVVSIAASLTFVGHGLYALGFHAVPLAFQSMTMRILGCDQGMALIFLQVAGWLDMVAVLALWIPRARIVGLGYMVFWGGATALARVWAYAGSEGWDPWLVETAVRTTHWMLPLLLLVSARRSG